jgi:hypothetical protein
MKTDTAFPSEASEQKLQEKKKNYEFSIKYLISWSPQYKHRNRANFWVDMDITAT